MAKKSYGKGPLKAFSDDLSLAWQYGSVFIRLAVVASKICEIPRNSPKIRTYSSLRSIGSSKVIDLGVSQKCIMNFLLVINSNIGRLLLFSRYWRLKIKNTLLSHPTLVWRSVAE